MGGMRGLPLMIMMLIIVVGTNARCILGPTGATGAIGPIANVTENLLPITMNTFDIGSQTMLFHQIYTTSVVLEGDGPATLDMPYGGIVVQGYTITTNLKVNGFLFSSLIPFVDNTYSLGSSLNRFKDIFANNIDANYTVYTRTEIVLNSTSTRLLFLTGTILNAPLAVLTLKSLTVSSLTVQGPIFFALNIDPHFHALKALTFGISGPTFSAPDASGLLQSLSVGNNLIVNGNIVSGTNADGTLKSAIVSNSVVTETLSVAGNATFNDRVNVYGGVVLNNGGTPLNFYDAGFITGYFCGIWGGNPPCHNQLLTITWERIGLQVTVNIPAFAETKSVNVVHTLLSFCNVSTASPCSTGVSPSSSAYTSLLPAEIVPTPKVGSPGLLTFPIIFNNSGIRFQELGMFLKGSTPSGFIYIDTVEQVAWNPAPQSGTMFSSFNYYL